MASHYLYEANGRSPSTTTPGRSRFCARRGVQSPGRRDPGRAGLHANPARRLRRAARAFEELLPASRLRRAAPQPGDGLLAARAEADGLREIRIAVAQDSKPGNYYMLATALADPEIGRLNEALEAYRQFIPQAEKVFEEHRRLVNSGALRIKEEILARSSARGLCPTWSPTGRSWRC